MIILREATMKTYKASVVGCGMIFNSAHLPAIEDLKGRIEIAAVCDERADAAAFTAEKLGVPWFTDPAEMLRSVDSDLLINCTPNAFHKPLTILGLESGRHVICEKPVALSYADILAILAVSDKTGKKFFPAQTGRFTNANITLKKWISDGLLGDVYLVDLDIIRRRGIPTWGQFHKKDKNLAGAFADMCVHNVDALVEYLGNPRLVSARTRMYSPISGLHEEVQVSTKESGAFGEGVYLPRTDFDIKDMSVEEYAAGMIFFEENLTVSFRCAWALNLPEKSETRVAGTLGGAVLPQMELYRTFDGYQSVIMPKVFDNTSNRVSDWGHWVMYEKIMEDLDGKAPYPITREQMKSTAAILEAVYRSAELDREVLAGEILGTR